MNSSLDKYPEIKRHFEEEWLRKEYNKSHPLFTILHETEYLKGLNRYLQDVKVKKLTVDHLKASNMFWDVYYELEIAYFLRQLGFEPELNEKISGHETDILLREQELDVEVTHLHFPEKIESASTRIKPKSKTRDVPKGVKVTHLMEEHMIRYFEEREFQNIYPIIVCFCPDIMGSCEDLTKIVANHTHNIPKEISALALWKYKRIQCFYDIPCRKKLQLKSSKLKEFFCQ
jgi:hypothetical protein